MEPPSSCNTMNTTHCLHFAAICCNSQLSTMIIPTGSSKLHYFSGLKWVKGATLSDSALLARQPAETSDLTCCHHPLKRSSLLSCCWFSHSWCAADQFSFKSSSHVSSITHNTVNTKSCYGCTTHGMRTSLAAPNPSCLKPPLHLHLALTEMAAIGGRDERHLTAAHTSSNYCRQRVLYLNAANFFCFHFHISIWARGNLCSSHNQKTVEIYICGTNTVNVDPFESSIQLIKA